MVRRHIIFYGRVQGVGFRYYCVLKARALDLTGWVRNLYDGSVEAEIQGPEDDIQALIDFLDQQRWIDITRIDAQTIPLMEEYGFFEH